MDYGYIVNIREVKDHFNSEDHRIGLCLKNQVVVSKEIKEKDLGVYFYPGTKLSIQYLMANKLIVKDIYGRVTESAVELPEMEVVEKDIKGIISEGLYMPIQSLEYFGDVRKMHEGDKVDVIGGIPIVTKTDIY